jgi:transcriptional regulator with XRE-family HTH domain
MTRPSAPLLEWLRDMLKQKGLNTAHLADASGLPRARVRKILSGAEDMTVDELMMLSDALQLDPSDLSAATVAQLPSADAIHDAADAGPLTPVHGGEDAATEPELPAVDPWGNQPEQLFKIAFALGCDFFFLADTAALEDSGVPAAVVDQYRGRELPIKLDAAYHKYNDPQYLDDAIQLTLSFDKLYDCTFKWSAIRQLVLFPVAPEGTADEEEPEPDPPSGGPPHLRLVT